MKHEFAILPWEFRGANFDPAPHALTSLELGGRKRDFLLKMREGIIYFKEPESMAVLAVPSLFEKEMREEELVRAWFTEVTRENYGRFLWDRFMFEGIPFTSVVVSIHRADFVAWVSDAFYSNWHKDPRQNDGRTLDIWKNDIEYARWRTVHRVRFDLVDRVMPESERQSVKPYWFSGSEPELRHIFAVAIQLYVRGNAKTPARTCTFSATNPMTQRTFRFAGSPMSDRGDLLFSPAFHPVLRVLNHHFTWVGINWDYHTPRLSKSSKVEGMAAKWGEHWRGNYCISTPSIELEVPLVASLSQHERLELLLQLRDWLADKVSPEQSAKWLSEALD